MKGRHPQAKKGEGPIGTPRRVTLAEWLSWQSFGDAGGGAVDSQGDDGWLDGIKPCDVEELLRSQGAGTVADEH